jgi:hypothetical protein
VFALPVEPLVQKKPSLAKYTKEDLERWERLAITARQQQVASGLSSFLHQGQSNLRKSYFTDKMGSNPLTAPAASIVSAAVATSSSSSATTARVAPLRHLQPPPPLRFLHRARPYRSFSHFWA